MPGGIDAGIDQGIDAGIDSMAPLFEDSSPGSGSGGLTGGGGSTMQILKGTLEGLRFQLTSDVAPVPALDTTPICSFCKAGEIGFTEGPGTTRELGVGWYEYLPQDEDDINVLGSMIMKAVGAGAIDLTKEFQVVAFDPQNPLTLGLSSLLALAQTIVAYGTLAPLPLIGEPDFIFSPSYNQPTALLASESNLLGVGLAVSAPGRGTAPDGSAYEVDIGLDALIPGTANASGNITWYEGTWVQPGICILALGDEIALLAGKRYRVYARLKDRVPSHAASVFDIKVD